MGIELEATSGACIGVLGAGESGLGAAFLARAKGFEVFLSDRAPIGEAQVAELEAMGARWENGQHTLETLAACALVVKSPGVPGDAPVVQALRKRGVPIVSEIEFAGRYTRAKKICVTGSNGKTTTVSLLYHMLKKAGRDVVLAGNIGSSFARQVAKGEHDYYVLELSSFQLEDMYDFKADIAVILNITPDHLDRYGYDMQRYVDAKFRITRNLTESECFIYSSDDAETMGRLAKMELSARRLPFSQRMKEAQGAWSDGEAVHFAVQEGEAWEMPIRDFSLRGKHNVNNSMVAGIVGEVLRLPREVIRASLHDFVGIPHRLELVGEVEGVRYINDSKATNVDAVWYALESMKTPVVWIAGGTDKGNDYSALQGFVREKVHALVCLGVDNAKLRTAFAGLVDTFVETRSAEEAVREAHRLARAGDTVLLSPACASFDLFKSYEDRGDQFKQWVKRL